MKNSLLFVKILPIVTMIIGIILVEGVFVQEIRSSGSLRDLNIRLPPEIEKNNPSFEALTVRHVILFDPIKILIGGIVGLILGIVLVRLIHPSILSDWKQIYIRHGLYKVVKAIFYCIIGVFTWHCLYWLLLNMQGNSFDSMKRGIAFRSASLLCILIAWVILWRNTKPSKLICRGLMFFARGPVSWFEVPWISKRIFGIVWTTTWIILLFLIRPPWQAFGVSSNGKGHGEGVFAGFHFICAPIYDICGDAPYIVAEIDHKTKMVLIIITMILAGIYIIIPYLLKLFFMLFGGKRRQRGC